VYAKPTAPRSIGGILDDGIRLYRDRFTQSWPLALGAQLILTVPTVIIQYEFHGVLAAGASPQAMFTIVKAPIVWLPYLIGAVVFFGFYNALIVQLEGAGATEVMSRGRALAVGFRLLPRTILLFIVMFLALLAAGMFIAFLAGFVKALHVPNSVGLLAAALGAAVAIYAWGRAFLANIALIVEDAGVFHSFGISWTLIKNHWWRTATIYTIGLILAMAFYVVVAFINAALAGVSLRNPFGTGALVSELVSIVGGAVLMSFVPAILLATYHDLKMRKEGADLAGRVNALAPQQ
jgi:hypothetical protein